MALNQAVIGFGRSWGSPERQRERSSWEQRQLRYALLWGYMDGTAYDKLDEWARYKSDHGLISSIALLRNHTKRLVEFYHHHLYAGELSIDGLTLSDGLHNAIPLGRSTDPKLAAAIGQLWQWWGWVDGMRLVTLHTPTLGDSLVELVDDLPRQKILTNIVWPGYVKDLSIDTSANVTSYVKEYVAFDPSADNGRGEHYTFRRETDKQRIRTFKNDKPFDYDGFGWNRVNPYSFVPAVLYRHTNVGGTWGEPAIWGTQGQLDALNNLMSRLIDYESMVLDSPIFVSGTMPSNTIANQMNAFYAARAEEPDLEGVAVPASTLRIAQVSADAKQFAIEFDASHARGICDDLAKAMEANFPEIVFWDEVRDMQQLSKPGATQAMGDAIARFRAACGSYDRQTKKLHQMGVAMAGENLRSGAWRKYAEARGRTLTAAHEKFDGFDLTSYDDGDLDHEIVPRDLIVETPQERIALATLQQDAGVPRMVAFETMGFSRDVVNEWVRKGWISPLDSTSDPNSPSGVTPITQEIDFPDESATPIVIEPTTPVIDGA